MLPTRKTLLGAVSIVIGLSAFVSAIPALLEFEHVFKAEQKRLDVEFRFQIDDLYVAGQEVAEKILAGNEPKDQAYQLALELKKTSLESARLEATEYAFVCRVLDMFKVYLSDKEEGFEVFPGMGFNSSIFYLILYRMKYRAFSDAYRLTYGGMVSDMDTTTAEQRAGRESDEFRQLLESLLGDSETSVSDPQTEENFRTMLAGHNNQYSAQELPVMLDHLVEEIIDFKGCPESYNSASDSIEPKLMFCSDDTLKWLEFYVGPNLLEDIRLDWDRYERFATDKRGLGKLKMRNTDPPGRAPEYYIARWSPDEDMSDR